MSFFPFDNSPRIMNQLPKYFHFLVFLIAFFISPRLSGQDISKDVQNCALNAGKDAIYLQDFKVDKSKFGSDGNVPVKFTMLLKKNVRYRFTACKSSSFTGKLALKLYDESQLMGTTYNPATGKEYPGFDFVCTKTGVYHLFIEFPDGTPGEAAAILSYVETK